LNVFISNKKKNKNFFSISVNDSKKNIYSLINKSKNYHDNFILKKNKKVLFIQKKSNNPNISRQIASGKNFDFFFSAIVDNDYTKLFYNLDLCLKIHKLINSINNYSLNEKN